MLLLQAGLLLLMAKLLVQFVPFRWLAPRLGRQQRKQQGANPTANAQDTAYTLGCRAYGQTAAVVCYVSNRSDGRQVFAGTAAG